MLPRAQAHAAGIDAVTYPPPPDYEASTASTSSAGALGAAAGGAGGGAGAASSSSSSSSLHQLQLHGRTDSTSLLVDLLNNDSDVLSRPSSESLHNYSDAYDSATEGTSSLASSQQSGHRTAPSSSASSSALADDSVASASTTSTPLHYGGPWSGDEAAGNGLGALYFGSHVSSRAASPVPGTDGFDGYLSYRAASRNRSRTPSGYSTPVTPADKEDYYQNHHYATSALLRKVGGALTPDVAPVIARNDRKPGWWAKRAEQRRRRNSDATDDDGTAPLLGNTAGVPSKSGRNRSCLSAAWSAFLRQPWVPTKPFTILFSLLLFGCFAATLTTFLVNILSSDREPPPWRQYCQEQRPFPHDLADSLKPVNVFVGVFSVDAAADRRNAIRLTFGKHSEPIDPRTGRPAHNVQLKFVIGRPRPKWAKRIALEMEMFSDLVVLDIEENMNQGKTFKYFTWAAENATVPVYYSRKGEAGMVDGVKQVGVGFKKADYVVKADDDSFIRLDELERHLRVTPRENTYWGYLIRNRFMAGEVYALSADLVNYIATYPRPKAWTIGKEDQRMAKWMRNHPNVSSIHWISERCWIYDHPKAGTTYSRGFTFPDHVEEIRAEGRRGISEEERVRRGGEFWQSYSTVSKWRQVYKPPSKELSVEEQIEALVEGGGRWNAQGWRSDNGRGPEAVHVDRLLFDNTDSRLIAPDFDGVTRATRPHPTAAGVKPGAPNVEANLPTARTTHFGKDLFRDPNGLGSVSYLRKRAANVQEGPTGAPLGEGEYEVHNLVHGPFDNGPIPDVAGTLSSDAGNSTTAASSSAPAAPSASASSVPITEEEFPEKNEPTSQIRIGQHAYAVPAYDERFLPAPSLRYDPTTLSLRQKRMLGRPNGGTVAVHYLKRNEWFFETALALIGRERMWDNGVDAPAYPDSPYSTNTLLEPYSKTPLAVSAVPPHALGSVMSASDTGLPEDEIEVLPALWGGARMYGSPIVLENGMIVDGRRAEANREVVIHPPGSRPIAAAPPQTVGETVASRVSRITGGGRAPMVALAEMDGVEIIVGGDSTATDSNDPVQSQDTDTPAASNDPVKEAASAESTSSNASSAASSPESAYSQASTPSLPASSSTAPSPSTSSASVPLPTTDTPPASAPEQPGNVSTP
ncbi:hypothetical protein JCM10908_001274 [Rhodotorula pacifica]|uniref:uncharacterized protein n=1 Tax=Rhodotorula pacifica TaxID=1495444 RepID=UPI00316DA040